MVPRWCHESLACSGTKMVPRNMLQASHARKDVCCAVLSGLIFKQPVAELLQAIGVPGAATVASCVSSLAK